MINYFIFAIIGLFLGRLVFIYSKRVLFGQSLLKLADKCYNCDQSVGYKLFIPFSNYNCASCQFKLTPNCLIVEIISVINMLLVYHFFKHSPNLIPYILLSNCLLASSITDFWTKLIPHEITYPGIILGLIYSYFIKNDIMNSLAGIGVSYILFDFIAFYGHKYYVWVHRDEIDEILKQNDITDINDLEVMGGADAVLSALIASFLGLNYLALALILSFVMGALLGGYYMGLEMYHQKILKNCVKPMIIYGIIGFGIALICFGGMCMMFNINISSFGLPIGLFTAAGALIGFLVSAKVVSKPFPFGPAIAIGGLISMYLSKF